MNLVGRGGGAGTPGPGEPPEAEERPPQPPAPAEATAGTGRNDDGLVLVLRLVVAALANVAVMTGLLVYFGWQRSRALAGRLRIPERMLGLSTEDYVLRSVGPVFMILLGVGVAGLLGLGLERLVTPFVRGLLKDEEDRRRRRLGALAVVLIFFLGAGLPALVLALRPVWRLGTYAVFPASLGAALLVWFYAAYLLRPPVPRPRPRLISLLTYGFVGLLLLLAVFWTAGRIAEVQGTDAADEIVYGLRSRPGVIVTSDVPLHLEGPGIETVHLEPPEGPQATEAQTRYRYTGLRLLTYGGGRLFLVHDDWPWEDGTVTVLEDDDPSLRFHFVRDLENEATRSP